MIKIYGDVMANRYLFIDTETTGLDPKKNGVIEIGAIIYEDDADGNPIEIASFQGKMHGTYFESIDLEALQINGRSLIGDLCSTTTVSDQVWQGFGDWLIQYVTKDTIIIGHNIKFDLDFLIKNGVRYNLDFRRILGKPVIDTKQIALFLNDADIVKFENSRMITVFNTLFPSADLNTENAHQAVADASMCASIYFKMRDIL